MYRSLIALSMVAALSCFTTIFSATVPAGWKTLKDSTGVCQMSVPGAWEADRNVPGHVNAPGWGGAMLLFASKGAKAGPMDPGTQQALGVGKMFENSKERVFFAGKPTPPSNRLPATISYHVDVAVAGKVCTAQIDVKASFSEDDIKSMVASIQ